MIKRPLIALLAVSLIGCAETYEKVEIKHNIGLFQSYWLCSKKALDGWSPPATQWRLEKYPHVNGFLLPQDENLVKKHCIIGEIDESKIVFDKGFNANVVSFQNVEDNYKYFLSIPDVSVDLINNQYRTHSADVSIYRIERFDTMMNSADFEVIIEDKRY